LTEVNNASNNGYKETVWYKEKPDNSLILRKMIQENIIPAQRIWELVQEYTPVVLGDKG
jgi:hypothetical protein